MTLISFEHIEIQEIGEQLVDLSRYPFEIEPFYFQKKLSDDPKLYTREAIAEKLVTIQNKLRGRTFKIWDPWRSRVVQNNIYQQFWNELSVKHSDWSDDELKAEVGKFVTIADNPDRIPPHASGGAIDLTLVTAGGTEINMGTGFDHFGPEAASLYYEENGRDEAIRDNRRFLREAMMEEDFCMDNDEWWHFDYGNQLWAAKLDKPFAIYGEKTSVQ